MTHSCQLENFCGQVFKDSGNVDCRLGPYAHLVLGVVLEETLDTTTGELEKRLVYAADHFADQECARKSQRQDLEIFASFEYSTCMGRSRIC